MAKDHAEEDLAGLMPRFRGQQQMVESTRELLQDHYYDQYWKAASDPLYVFQKQEDEAAGQRIVSRLRNGLAVVVYNEEESALVADLWNRGKGGDEIQLALAALRSSRRTEARGQPQAASDGSGSPGATPRSGRDARLAGPGYVPELNRLGSKSTSTVQDNRRAGQAGEDFLARTYGGDNQVTLSTSLGNRVVDNLSSGVARESKVGLTPLSSRTRSQIAKDAELMDTPGSEVTATEWHFFPSHTGVGPTAELRAALEEAGIAIVLH